MKIINVSVPAKEQSVIWRHHDSIYNYCGWPSICRDDNGVLYAAVSGFRIQHMDPNGKNIIIVSCDEGKTWSCPIVVNDSYLDDRDTGIVYLGGGKMLMTWFSARIPADFVDAEPMTQKDGGFDPRDRRIIKATVEVLQDLIDEGDDITEHSYVKLSDDYGMTWGENIPVPMTAPHGPTLLNDGRLLYLGKDYKKIGDEEQKVRTYISADGGKTWEKISDITLPDPENHNWNMFHEPHVAQLPNGRLVGAIRVHERKGKPDTCYVTLSDDEGKTWTTPKDIGISGLPPHIFVHSSGAVIMSYACRAHNNRSERACVSYDNGETWTEDYVISELGDAFSDFGYPATVELDDGSLFTVYYQGYPGDQHTSLLGTRWNLKKNI